MTQGELFGSVDELMTEKGQCGRLYRWLKQGRTITQMDALRQLAIMRLASRVSDLVKMGVDIESKRVTVTNRYNESCSVSEYKLRS